MAGATVNTTVVQGALTAVATPARFTGTRTFYSAATSGGSPTTLNTVIVTGGYINSWTQTTPSAGRTVGRVTTNRCGMPRRYYA